VDPLQLDRPAKENGEFVPLTVALISVSGFDPVFPTESSSVAVAPLIVFPKLRVFEESTEYIAVVGGVVTVRVSAGLTTVPSVAVICDVPGPTPVANPCVPAALLMVATDGVAEAHVTLPVMFCIEASL